MHQIKSHSVGYIPSQTVTFTTAASHVGLTDPDGFKRCNLPSNSPSVPINMAKGQHWLSMSGEAANSLLTQVALTSPEHSILHSGPKLSIGRLQPLYTTHLFFCCFAHSEKQKCPENTEHDFIDELLQRDSPTHLTRWDVSFVGMSVLGRWHFRCCIANISQCQLHPVPSYVILEAMTIGKSTISHSLSDSCIFMHIYEGVIPLNVAVLLQWGLFWMYYNKKAAFLWNMQPLFVMRANTAKGIRLKNDTWQTRQALC